MFWPLPCPFEIMLLAWCFGWLDVLAITVVLLFICYLVWGHLHASWRRTNLLHEDCLIYCVFLYIKSCLLLWKREYIVRRHNTWILSELGSDGGIYVYGCIISNIDLMLVHWIMEFLSLNWYEQVLGPYFQFQ